LLCKLNTAEFLIGEDDLVIYIFQITTGWWVGRR
jgi:hypothetical protein